ncbi:Response regulator PleD [Rosistilla carotiformis]|uniref:diguanylate cyclase n=1 Tax=Rosistilla carotiformis TaxID=2528017 RepID=A0A518K1S2_9BACT|nr:GGDEF domain-containing protein [Rosistilla carotiformis]QDV71715.1 Response regulator PleD [Rosistilla carotiformis]
MGIQLVALIALSCGCSGLLCGWFLNTSNGAADPGRTADAEQNRTERVRLEKLAASLRNVTTSVAAEVDAHQTKIQQVSDSLTDSDEDHVLDAVASLIAANELMQKQLGEAQNQIRSQAQAIETAEELALTDALTGLNNRRALDRQMKQRHALGDTVAHPTTFMLIDVDHFKNFNDLHGHLTGDEVLKHVGRLLTNSLSDVGFVARYGGEEFAVLFSDMQVAEIKDRADEVRATFGEQEFFVDDQCLQVTASAGLAQLEPGESIESWIERADNALYNAKDEGRDQAYWMDGDVAFPVKDEDAEETADEQIFVDEPKASVEDPDVVALPDLKTLSKNVGNGFAKLQEERIPFCLMAIHVESDTTDDAWQQVILASLHASVRGIDADRIGFDGEHTFVVCLPSTDESIAKERAKAIRQSIDTVSDSAWRIQIATTSATATETFDEAMQRTIAMNQATDAEEPISV